MKVLFVINSVDKYFYAGPAAISAMLKRHGHEAALINYDRSYTLAKFRDHLRRIDPDLVGFSVLTYQWPMIQELARTVKEALGVPTMCGGFHVSFSPEQVIMSPHVDFVCKGEGDFAVLDLVSALERGGDTRSIPNIWAKERGPRGELRIIRNEIRPLARDMDDYPFWDRELYDFDSLLEKGGALTYELDSRIMPVQAGRGCPYLCSYCGNQALLKMYKGKGVFVRRRSPDNVVEELLELIDRYKVEAFEFWDEDFFAIQKSWLREFFAKYREKVGIPFFLGVRADNADRENLRMAKDAGCHLICMGVEHGNEDFRRKYLNRHMTNEKLIEAFAFAREIGLERASLNIMGFPFETKENVLQTLELNRKLDPDYFHYFVYQAFPGCDLHDVAREHGFLPNVYYAVYQNPEGALVQPTLALEDVKEAWAAFDEFRRSIDERREKSRASRKAVRDFATHGAADALVDSASSSVASAML